MPRGSFTPTEIATRKIISDNLKEEIYNSRVTQTELANGTGIPKSTLSGYINARSTPTGENSKKIADFLKIDVAKIDPRFKEDVEDYSNNDEVRPVLRKLARNANGMSNKKSKDLAKALNSVFKEMFGEE